MLFSRSLIKTNSQARGDSANYELMLKAGLVHQIGSGFYDFLPLARKVLNNIESIVMQEMNNAGALQISMPIVQPASLWSDSGRWDIYGQEMFRLTDRKNAAYCLGPTHEELVVELMKSQIKSHRDLPVTVYQIGNKFRDEIRPRGGIVRAREFIMKDAYSFDKDTDGLDQSYLNMREAYLRIFQRANITVFTVSANSGEIGGTGSEEFLAPSIDGEDQFMILDDNTAIKVEDNVLSRDNRITRGIEVGHIFKLGTRYSEPLGLIYQDKTNKSRHVEMGCYGIGISRLLAVIVDQNKDDNGIIWPAEIAPYPLVIIPIKFEDGKVYETTMNLYQQFQNAGIEVLLDDREVSAGAKFNDAKLLGFPYILSVGPKNLASGNIELEERATGMKSLTYTDNAVNEIIQRMY